MLRFFLIIFLSFFLYSCAFDNSPLVKRIDLLEQKISFNSQRIQDNSKRIEENERKISSIEAQIEKIKKRLAKERAQNNFLAQIPPATVIDNLTESESLKEKKQEDSVVKSVKIKEAVIDNSSKGKKEGLSYNMPKNKKLKNKSGIDNSTDRKIAKVYSPDKLYKKALSFYFKGDYDGAAELFNKFLNTFSRDNPLYDNSMYWLAYCYIHKGEIEKAIGLLNKLIEEFPYSSLDKGGKTDAAIFTLIKLYKKMGDNSKTQHYRELLIKRFPFSKYAGYLKRRSG